LEAGRDDESMRHVGGPWDLHFVLFGEIVEHMANNGFKVALLPVSPVSLVVVPTVPVRLPSVTCAVPVACSPLPRSGASGTSRSARARSESNRLLPLEQRINRMSGDTLPFPLSPPRPPPRC
jgi:hypothetical protein